MFACREGNKEAVEHLLKKKAHVNKQNKSGWTALMFACENGHLGVVKELLKKAAGTSKQEDNDEKRARDEDQFESVLNTNAVNDDGYTALMIAIKRNDIDIIEALINTKGIDFNVVAKLELETALTLMSTDKAIMRHPKLKDFQYSNRKALVSNMTTNPENWEDFLQYLSNKEEAVGDNSEMPGISADKMREVIDDATKCRELRETMLKNGAYDVRRIKNPETR